MRNAWLALLLATFIGCGPEPAGKQEAVSNAPVGGSVPLQLVDTRDVAREFVLEWDHAVAKLAERPNPSDRIKPNYATQDRSSLEALLKSHLNRSNAPALQAVANAARGTSVSDRREEIVSTLDGAVVRGFPMRSFMMNKNGTYATYPFVEAGSGGPLVVDLDTFEMVTLSAGSSLTPRPKLDWNVAWSADGKYLAYSGVFGGYVEAYDPALKAAVWSTHLGSDVDAIAWSPTSDAIAVLSHQGSIRKGPIALLSALAGHPRRRYKIIADVLWIEGEGRVKATVLDDFEAGEGEIVWASEGD